MSENGNGNGEETEPDVNEIASRWYKGAPKTPSEEQEPDERDYQTIDGDIVSYHGSGHIYLPTELQKKLGTHEWGSPIHLPAEYDEEASKLTISLEPVDVEEASEDSEDDSDSLASDGGGLSETQLAELINDLNEKRGDSR